MSATDKPDFDDGQTFAAQDLWTVGDCVNLYELYRMPTVVDGDKTAAKPRRYLSATGMWMRAAI